MKLRLHVTTPVTCLSFKESWLKAKWVHRSASIIYLLLFSLSSFPLLLNYKYTPNSLGCLTNHTTSPCNGHFSHKKLAEKWNSNPHSMDCYVKCFRNVGMFFLLSINQDQVHWLRKLKYSAVSDLSQSKWNNYIGLYGPVPLITSDKKSIWKNLVLNYLG